MKAILEFELPDDEQKHRRAVQADDLGRVVWDIAEMLRRYQKYGHTWKTADESVQGIRDDFYRILQDNGVDWGILE